MNSTSSIKESAIKTLRMEAEAVLKLASSINGEFVQIVNLILNSKGRVVITGIGKSANIANKTVATLNSTGTPAVFMHAADAIHGDLGNVQKEDLVICASKSGNSPEIKVLIPLLKNMGNPIIAMVGNVESFLAKEADFILNCTVDEEACPFNLTPTTSSATQLAMGDALAIALMEMRGFSASDFAVYHPGGSLGKRLYTRVKDLIDVSNKPAVTIAASVKDVILEMSRGRLGATAVLEGDQLVGMITDGDIRRMLERGESINSTCAEDIMSKSPKTLDHEELIVNAFHLMEKNSITQIIATNEGQYTGILHLHDILKEGIF